MNLKQGTDTQLDVITIGRCSVDLYGQQIGSRLEDVTSFAKSVGGCPSNIAIGAARLGLKSAVITRVGNEQMGHYVREQMLREGVSTEGITTDDQRLTALVLLSVENDKTFPLIFYRENCADSALSENDIDPALIARTKSVLVTGTHFAKPHNAEAQYKAIKLARQHKARVIFDIDYRPNLWGLAGHAAGDSRYIRSETVSQHLLRVLPDCDLIVGTEEEIHAAGGSEDTLESLRRIRSVSQAVIVLKRGPMGCVVFPDLIPQRIEDGIVGQGFPIEVYNVLGAGDAFMSGFLRGYLKGESHETSATWANACGAFAVSRLLCSPESPTYAELQYFLKHGSTHRALRKDDALNHLHWATTRLPLPEQILALAIDHRKQLEEIADVVETSRDRISEFKRLAISAIGKVSGGKPGYGTFLDDRYGREAMFDAAKFNLWVARPLEQPGSRPLSFEFTQDVGSRIIEWPNNHTIKCLAFFHPDDPQELKAEQLSKLLTVHQAGRKIGREVLIEIIAGKHGPLTDDAIARVLTELYMAGIKPDWWKLEPQASSAAWDSISSTIAKHDPYCRGVLILGLEAPEDQLALAFHAASRQPIVKGFAIGRSIFNDAARHWLAGKMTDDDAVSDMAERFLKMTRIWHQSRSGRAG
jgi:5-dehydro-2-deoxygluconokinase